MNKIKIVVYGADWCPDVVRAKVFMDSLNVTYESIDTDLDETGKELVMRINNGKCIVPTILINEHVYVNPDDEQITLALKAQNKP